MTPKTTPAAAGFDLTDPEGRAGAFDAAAAAGTGTAPMRSRGRPCPRHGRRTFAAPGEGGGTWRALRRGGTLRSAVSSPYQAYTPKTKAAALLLAAVLLAAGCMGASTAPTLGARWVPAWAEACILGKGCATVPVEVATWWGEGASYASRSDCRRGLEVFLEPLLGLGEPMEQGTATVGCRPVPDDGGPRWAFGWTRGVYEFFLEDADQCGEMRQIVLQGLPEYFAEVIPAISGSVSIEAECRGTSMRATMGLDYGLLTRRGIPLPSFAMLEDCRKAARSSITRKDVEEGLGKVISSDAGCAPAK